MPQEEEGPKKSNQQYAGNEDTYKFSDYIGDRFNKAERTVKINPLEDTNNLKLMQQTDIGFIVQI